MSTFNKFPMQVRYMQAQNSSISTRDDLLQQVAQALEMTPKEFSDKFLIEEYSPTIGDPLHYLMAPQMVISFTQQFIVRMKTQEEIDLERVNRANALAGM